jgi:hypothetical protein
MSVQNDIASRGGWRVVGTTIINFDLIHIYIYIYLGLDWLGGAHIYICSPAPENMS